MRKRARQDRLQSDYSSGVSAALWALAASMTAQGFALDGRTFQLPPQQGGTVHQQAGPLNRRGALAHHRPINQ